MLTRRRIVADLETERLLIVIAATTDTHSNDNDKLSQEKKRKVGVVRVVSDIKSPMSFKTTNEMKLGGRQSLY